MKSLLGLAIIVFVLFLGCTQLALADGGSDAITPCTDCTEMESYG